MYGSFDVAPCLSRLVPARSAIVAGLLLGTLQAQIGPPVPAPAEKLKPADVATASDSPGSQDPIQLSPFAVTTDRDRGFMAVKMGTATNLGLDMKDVPAAYSIMTRDFIDALGITNIQEASQWVTNGNGVVDGNGRDVFNIPVLNGNRGVTYSSGQQRNYFLSSATMDSYSLERYEFGRGPNAALFNVGANTALGGGFSATTKRARLDRPFETVSLTGGSWDYKRSTLDVNSVVVPDKLAIRANAVWFDRGGWRMREYEKTKGITLTSTYMLTKKTELRLDFANDSTNRNDPQISMFDSVTGWDGVTVADRAISDAVNNGTAPINAAGQLLALQGTTQGIARQGGAHYVWSPASGATSVINYQNEAQTRRGDDTATTPMLWNGVLVTRGTGLPFGNGATAASAPAFNNGINGEVNFLYQLDLPPDRFDRAIGGSGGRFQLPTKRFTNSLDIPILTERMRDYGITLSHQFTDNLFLDFAGNVNQVHDHRFGGLNTTRVVRIDINRNLPNGAPNPNFLQPFYEAPVQWNNRYTDNAGLRAALGYIADLGKWGHWTVNATGAMNERRIRNRNYNYSMTSLPDPRMWQGGDDLIFQRYYWNQAGRPLNEADIPHTATIVNWGNGSSLAPTTTTQSINPRYVLNGWDENFEKFNFARLATSGRFFDNKLVLLVAGRFDSYKTINHARAEFGDLPANWDGNTLYYKPDAPSDWLSLSYVPAGSTTPVIGANRPRVNPANLPYTLGNNGVQFRDPAYADQRFRNDYSAPITKGTGMTGSYGFVYHALKWADVSANFSTAFVPPPAGAFELDNAIIKPETGKGYDLGVRLATPDGKLQLNTDYFYNERNHVRNDPPWKGSVNNLVARNSYTDPNPNSVNSLGIPPITGTDYVSQKNHGVEIEMVGSFGRNLRVSVNVGTGKLINTKRWPLSQSYVAAHADDYRRLLEQAGGKLDSTQKPANALHAPGTAVIDPTKTPAIQSERDNAITDYNNLWALYERIFTQKDQMNTLGDRTVVNAFADYTFNEGWAKGLRLGLGVQYRTKTLIGFRSGDSVVDPTTGVAIDNPAYDDTTPLYAPAPTIWDATIGYTYKIKGGNRWLSGKQLQFQLVIRNLLNDQGVYYQDTDVVMRPPNGDVTKANRVSVPVRNGLYNQPTSFLLTTTLKL